jgi:hypothetical protein
VMIVAFLICYPLRRWWLQWLSHLLPSAPLLTR